MKVERKVKESAYSTMQKESKFCESLKNEITKLKESKVSLLKQQKVQSAAIMKLKKDQVVKLTSMKKSEVKKLQQMNGLKNELNLKDRVLGHKQREISRLASKLKACEDHVTQLLRIQNRHRNNSTTQLKPSVNNPATNLSLADHEHLKSTKNILDNLIVDRIELKLAKDEYERKSRALHQLQLEIEEAGKDLHQHSHHPSNSNEDDEVDDEDDPIFAAEVNIDRIAAEMEVLELELHDLARKLDSGNPQSQGFTSTSSWEELGREVIQSLSLVQIQCLAWDLLRSVLTE